MSFTRLLASSLFVLLLGGVAAAPRASAEELPAALLSLVPEEPVALVVAPSIDGFSRDLGRVIALFDEETAAGFDLVEMLEGDMANVGLVVDTSRPAALALSLPADSPMPVLVAVLPLLDPSMSAGDFVANVGMEPLYLDGGYVVLGNDPAYEPGRTRPALAIGLPEADIAARLDLRTVFDRLGPMLDMMLTMTLSQPAPVDSTADPLPEPQPIMQQEDIEKVLALLGIVRDGIVHVELALDVDGNRAELSGGLELDPEGPMALGVQPDPARALDLSRSLPDPAGAFVLTANAIDLSPVLAFQELLLDLIANLDDGEPLGLDWSSSWRNAMDAITELHALMWLPHAGAVRVGPSGLDMQAIVLADDAVDLAARTVDTVSALSIPGFSFVTKAAREVDGVATTRIDPQIDMQAFFDSMGVEADDAGEMNAMMESVQGQFWPAWEIGARADRMFAATARDEHPDAMAALLAADAAPGAVPAALQEVVDWAGPGARAWTWMDLRGVFALVATMFANLPAEEGVSMDFPSAAELAALPPLPVHAAARIDQTWLRGRVALDLEAVARFAEIVSQMEED